MIDPLAPPAQLAAAGLWRTTAWIVVCKLLSSGATAAVAIVTARELGPSGRGVLVLLLTLASFLLLVCSLGLNVSGRILLVARDRRVELGEYLGLSAALVLVQMALCIVLGVALLPLVHIRLSLTEVGLFGLLGGSLLGPYLLNAAVNAYGHTTLAAVLDAAGSVAQLIAVIFLAVAGVRTVDPYVVVLVIGNVVQIVISLVALTRPGVPMRPRYRPAQWLALVRTGAPGIAMDISQALTFRLDRYLLGLFLTPATVGIYSVAATAPELLRLPTIAMTQPMFHRLASGSARVADFRRTRVLCLAGTGLLAAVTFVVAPSAVRVLFGKQYAAAVTPLRVLLLAELGIALFQVESASLAGGLGRVGDASAAAIAGLVVVAIGDVVLIPSHGILGAAWVSVVAYTVTGLVAHALLRWRLRHVVLSEGRRGTSTATGRLLDQG